MKDLCPNPGSYGANQSIPSEWRNRYSEPGKIGGVPFPLRILPDFVRPAGSERIRLLPGTGRAISYLVTFTGIRLIIEKVIAIGK